MRRSAFVTLTAGALVAGPQAARAAIPVAGLDGRTAVPVVRARAGGRELVVAIDTGSANSTLSPASAAALSLTGTTLRGMSIGGAVLRDHPMAIAALARWEAVAGFPLDGVLGYEAFRDRAITLDFRNRRLTFPDVLPDGESTAITWLRYDDSSAPLVTFGDVTIDGFPGIAQFDTMMTKTIVIFETKFHDLAIDNDQRAQPYVYAGEQLRPGRIGSVRLGTTTIAASVHVYSADAAAHVPATGISLIAGDALFGRAVTLDFPGSLLILG
jgi:hypothetical protein